MPEDAAKSFEEDRVESYSKSYHEIPTNIQDSKKRMSNNPFLSIVKQKKEQNQTAEDEREQSASKIVWACSSNPFTNKRAPSKSIDFRFLSRIIQANFFSF